MRKEKYILFLLLFTTALFSQINFEKHIIANAPTGHFYSYYFIKDIDGDSLADISAIYDSTVVWYKNNGQGSFTLMQTIDESNKVLTVCVSDVDNDNYNDLLVGLYDTTYFCWYKNNGLQQFTTKNIITDTIEAYKILSEDIDGDNYNDLLTISNYYDYYSPYLLLYKNIDANGAFTFMQDLEDYTYDCKFAYINSDNYIDIVWSGGSASFLFWAENDGLGNFTPNYMFYYIDQVTDFDIKDMDNDGDNDILFTTITKRTGISYIENFDGEGDFDSINNRVSIDTTVFSGSICAIDIDNDNDFDIICDSSFYHSSQLFYYLNDGQGGFSEKQVFDSNLISYSYRDLEAHDLNYDGRMDLVVREGNKLIWYENKTGVNVKEISQASFSIFPNPAKSTITIQSKFKVTKIELYNNLGQLVLTKKNTQNVDVSSLEKGVYTCKVFGNNGSLGTEKIVIE